MNNKLFQIFTALTIGMGGVLGVQAVEVGDEAPCVVLNQIHLDQSEAYGCIREVVDGNHEYTALEFFSIDCSACAANLPKLKGIRDMHSDNATFRLVSIDRNEARVREFIRTQNTGFITALDLGRNARRAYGVIVTPTLIILDRDNIVVYRHEGVLGESDIAEISQLLTK